MPEKDIRPTTAHLCVVALPKRITSLDGIEKEAAELRRAVVDLRLLVEGLCRGLDDAQPQPANRRPKLEVLKGGSNIRR